MGYNIETQHGKREHKFDEVGGEEEEGGEAGGDEARQFEDCEEEGEEVEEDVCCFPYYFYHGNGTVLFLGRVMLECFCESVGEYTHEAEEDEDLEEPGGEKE